MARIVTIVALWLCACTDPARSFGDVVTDPDLPPRGEGDIDGAEGWYWYEKIKGSVHADDMGPPAGSCSGCHMGAPRDFTFVLVP